MRALVLMSLALLSCDDSSPSASPQEASAAGQDRRTTEPRADLASSGGSGLRQIEKALEGADHEAALGAFRELLEQRKVLFSESLAAMDENRASGGTTAKFAALEKRLQILDVRVEEALFALRQHDVDHLAVDQAIIEYRDEASRGTAIRELEGLDDP
jgi:hypothetical protein